MLEMMRGTLHHLDTYTAGWRHLPPLHVRSTPADLPVPNAPNDVQGLFCDGEVYLVGPGLPGDRVAQLLGHELVCHHGLRALLGRHWPGFMSAVASGSRSDPSLARARAHVQRAYRDADGEMRLPALLQADEAAARLAELLFDPELRPFLATAPARQRVRAILRHVQREVLLLDRPADAEEVRGALLEAEAFIRHGRGLRAPAAWWYRPRMPDAKPMGAKVPPCDLAEAEWLLEQETSRRRFWRDGEGALIGLGTLAGIVLLIVCIAVAVIGFAQIILGPFFR